MIEHTIQKHILKVLYYRRFARFRDLRPERVDTNLYSYHLKVMLKQRYIKKTEQGYALDTFGLQYVDRVSEAKMDIRTQPKIVTMLVIQRPDGHYLFQKRIKQPYIDTWTLPYGKLHIDDGSIMAASQREASEKLGLKNVSPKHIGDCYIRVSSDGTILTTTLVHVFRMEVGSFIETDRLCWMSVKDIGSLALAPAVREIISATAARNDDYFFEEFDVTW